MILWALFIVFPVMGVWIGWPVVARTDPYVGDTFYRVRIAYRKLGGHSIPKKLKTLLYYYVEAAIPKEWLAPLERILTLAGRPGGWSAIDVILLQFAMSVAMMSLDLWAKKTSPVFLLLLTIAVITMPWRRWLARIQARRLSASEQIRGLKRRYVSLLRRDTPFEESLRLISREAQGDFGIVFRQRLKEARIRGLSDSLIDLQREFKVAELTRFVQAVRNADRNSMAALADIVERQARDETARMDEFIEKRKATVQNRMRMFTALAFLYMAIFSGYFAWQILSVYFSSHSIFGL
jgi:Flp pilus assembly protein TadB